MIRQEWILALGVGMCAGLAAGCPSAAQYRYGGDGKGLQLPQLTAEQAAQLKHLPPSPYGPQPAPAAAPPVEQAKPQAELKGDIQPVALHPTSVPVSPPAPAPQPTETVPVLQTPQAEPAKPQAAPVVEEAPVLAALRCLLEKRTDDAIAHLLKYDKPTQDLLLCLLPLVARLGRGSLEAANPPDLAHLMEQLESALSALRLQAPLAIERLAYCRDIERYGVYDPLPDDYPFRPGEVVELYVELRNFASERHGPFYDIHLTGTLELCDAAGQARPLRVLPGRRTADRSRSPRHDHYQTFRFCVPENLRPGYYTLVVRVTDTIAHRTAQRSLSLRVTTRPIANP